MELTMNDAAKVLLDEYFQDYLEPKPVRVYLRPRFGKRGRLLAIKPDARSERDLEFELDGYTFLVSRHLAVQVGDWIKVEAGPDGGFHVTAQKCSGNMCMVS